MKRRPGRPRITEFIKCLVDYCPNRRSAKGFCHKHYEASRKGKIFYGPVFKPLCAFDPCDRTATSTIWCSAHYMQQYTGRPMKPIMSSREDPSRPGERNCKMCGEWKDRYADFYDGRNQQKQNECKPCQSKRNKRNTLIRQGRHEEAALVL